MLLSQHQNGLVSTLWALCGEAQSITQQLTCQVHICPATVNITDCHCPPLPLSPLLSPSLPSPPLPLSPLPSSPPLPSALLSPSPLCLLYPSPLPSSPPISPPLLSPSLPSPSSAGDMTDGSIYMDNQQEDSPELQRRGEGPGEKGEGTKKGSVLQKFNSLRLMKKRSPKQMRKVSPRHCRSLAWSLYCTVRVVPRSPGGVVSKNLRIGCSFPTPTK